MEWQDEAIILSTRKFGEGNLLLEAFTAQRGRYAGLVKGGASTRRRTGMLQPGMSAQLSWRARLVSHLGHFRVDLTESQILSNIFDSPRKLLGLQSFCALLNIFLPQGEPYPQLYQYSKAWLEKLSYPGWLPAYIEWELHILSAIGYGLDLSRCAGGGSSETLIWVSPKSGYAVSEEVGRPWAKKLLPLPSFLREKGENFLREKGETISEQDIVAGLSLTGFFIERALTTLSEKKLPSCRQRLVGGAIE